MLQIIQVCFFFFSLFLFRLTFGINFFILFYPFFWFFDKENQNSDVCTRDACYLAIGLAAFSLQDDFDFVEWFNTHLITELNVCISILLALYSHEFLFFSPSPPPILSSNFSL